MVCLFAMHSLYHVVAHIQTYGLKHKLLFTVCFMLLFWALFDSMLTYILPLKIVESGFNKTQMGAIISSSSLAGILFDLLLSRFLRSPNYRKIYASVFILSLMFIVLLQGATEIWTYVLSMVIWGFYWNLLNFGNMDLVSKTASASERSSAFGVIDVFVALGYLLTSIIAGIVVGEVITVVPFIFSGVMLGISFLFYLVLAVHKHSFKQITIESTPVDWPHQLQLLFKIGKQLLPVLVMTTMTCINQSFFWTIGPLVAEHVSDLGELGGLFLSSYLLPPLLFGWFVGSVTQKYGKKRTAVTAFLLSSVVISTLPLAQNGYVLLAVVFISATFSSFVQPSLLGTYADYISESKTVEKEIQGLNDLFYNIGWVLGPILAGLCADLFGNKQSFAAFGVMGILTALLIMKIMPKKIHIKI